MRDVNVIGGSDIGAIAGLNPYVSAWDVWARITGRAAPKADSLAMRLGRAAEPVVLAAYSEATKSEAQLWQETIVGPKPYLVATPDAKVVAGERQGRGLELKTASQRVAHQFGDESGLNLPEHYIAQCAWYRRLTGLCSWDCAVLILPDDLKIYHIPKLVDLEEALLEAAERFWRDHVEKDVPPDPSKSPAGREWIKKMFPRETSGIREAQPHEVALLEEYATVRRQLGELEQREEEIRAMLQAIVGEAEGIEWSGGRITWKYQERRDVDYKGIVQELSVPKDVVDRFTNVRATRVWRVNLR